MLKTIVKSSLLLMTFCFMLLPATAEGKAKEFLLEKGDYKTIKINNVKKVTFSKNVRACIDRSGKVRIDAVREGTAVVKVKTTHAVKRLKITIKPFASGIPTIDIHGLSEDEQLVADHVAGSCSANTLSEYPHLENYGQVPEKQKRVLEKEWEKIPKYMKDTLVFWRIPIVCKTGFGKKNRDAMGVTTIAQGKCRVEIKIQYGEGIFCRALIHEVAHVWHGFCLRYGVDVLKKPEIAEAWAANPHLYGDYGATDIAEFYAESVAVPLGMQIRVYTKEEMGMLLKKYGNVTSMKNNRGKKNHVVLRIEISEKDLNGAILSYNGVRYINGSTCDRFDTERKIATEKYYREKFKKKGKVVDYCIVGYCDADF